jgi:hypothetical protein
MVPSLDYQTLTGPVPWSALQIHFMQAFQLAFSEDPTPIILVVTHSEAVHTWAGQVCLHFVGCWIGHAMCVCYVKEWILVPFDVDLLCGAAIDLGGSFPWSACVCLPV